MKAAFYTLWPTSELTLTKTCSLGTSPIPRARSGPGTHPWSPPPPAAGSASAAQGPLLSSLPNPGIFGPCAGYYEDGLLETYLQGTGMLVTSP